MPIDMISMHFKMAAINIAIAIECYYYVHDFYIIACKQEKPQLPQVKISKSYIAINCKNIVCIARTPSCVKYVYHAHFGAPL